MCRRICGSKEDIVTIRADELTAPARVRILAINHGAETAIRTLPDGAQLTFRERDERSDAAAHRLAALRVEPGDRGPLPVHTDCCSHAVATFSTPKPPATALTGVPSPRTH